MNKANRSPEFSEPNTIERCRRFRKLQGNTRKYGGLPDGARVNDLNVTSGLTLRKGSGRILKRIFPSSSCSRCRPCTTSAHSWSINSNGKVLSERLTSVDISNALTTNGTRSDAAVDGPVP